MKRLKYIISILALLMTLWTATGWAQNVRLTPYRASTALYLNADRLFNYNYYEHVRLETGLSWVIPNVAAEHPKFFLGQWTLHAYAAYGFLDQGFKYGTSVQLRPSTSGGLPTSCWLRVSVKDDLEQAGSRLLEDYRMTEMSHNNSYVASRFNRVQAVKAEVNMRLIRTLETSFTLRYSREQILFDQTGRLYPNLNPDENGPFRHYTEGTLRLDYKKNLTVSLTAGAWNDGATHPYARLIGQYTTGDPEEGLHLWGQAGWASHGTPFSRLYDLSGTGGTPYYFEHTLLTVVPGRFAAELFTHLCLVYTAPVPLWDTQLSKPKPFLQLNLLWGQEAASAGEQIVDGITVQAPYMGLVEPATGFDGLLRWGLLDMGMAVAYQLTPPQAPYRLENPRDGIAFAIVAKLIV